MCAYGLLCLVVVVAGLWVAVCCQFPGAVFCLRCNAGFYALVCDCGFLIWRCCGVCCFCGFALQDLCVVWIFVVVCGWWFSGTIMASCVDAFLVGLM